MKYPKRISSKVDANRYLITYADLVTLLLGLFVIMYTSSQVDSEKFKEVTQALEKVFSSDEARSILESGDGILDGSKSILDDGGKISLKSGDLELIESQVQKKFEGMLEDDKLKIYKEGDALKIEMPEELLFASGKAKIQEDGILFLDSLANLLLEVPNKITIDGHTDNVPIKTFIYESNWHLSVARALNAGYSLIKFGLPESNLSIRGFGSQRPIEPNTTEEGKRRNRRIELAILEVDIETPAKIGYKNNANNEDTVNAGANNITR